MKYILVLIVAIALLFIGRRSAQYVYNPITKEIEPVKAYNFRQRNIVMCGDSHMVRGEWVSLFNRCDIGSVGVGGLTSGELISYTKEILNMRPEKCFILVGVNDIALDVPYRDYLSNIGKIIESLNGTKIFIHRIIYTAKGYRIPDINQRIMKFNKGLDSLCKARNIPVINLNEQLSDSGYLRLEYTSDKIHLNNAGYKIWAGELKKHF